MYPLGVMFGLGFDTSSEVALLGIASIQGSRGTSIWLILIFPFLFTGNYYCFPPPLLSPPLPSLPSLSLTELINISGNVSPRHHRRCHDVGFIHIYIPCQRQNRYPILLHRPHCYHRDDRRYHWLYPIVNANLEHCRTNGEILGWSRSCRRAL